MLRPPGDLGAVEAAPRRACARSTAMTSLDVALALGLLLRDVALELVVDLGVQVAQRVVLELALHPVDAEAVRQRRVDVERLLRDLVLPLGRQVSERAHVVRAVGELDQDDADVARHREEHLAEVLRLLLLAAGEVDLADLGDAVDQRRRSRCRTAPRSASSVVSVSSTVSCSSPVTTLGTSSRRSAMMLATSNGVDQVGLARLALLPCGPRRELVGAFDRVERCGGVVGANLVEEVVEGHPVPGANRARACSTIARATSSGVRRSVSMTRSYRARSW